MSDDKPPSDKNPPDDPPPALTPAAQAEEKLQPVIQDLPEKKQEEIKHTVEEFFMGFMQQGMMAPNLNPEAARIMAESIDKDNEMRFRYLTQKQQNEADESKRGYDFAVTCHNDRKRMMWPILITVLAIVVGCIIAGIYFAATGRDILGASLLTGTFSAVTGYLAGIGTSGFFKDSD